MGAEAKGLGIATVVAWMKRHMTGPQFEQLVRGAPGEFRESVENLFPTSWYNVALDDYLFSTFVELCHPRDAAARDKALQEMGRFVASDNLNTVYKTVFKFVPAGRVVGLLPRMWRTYFRGIEVSLDNLESRSGTCVVSGLGGVRYMAPVASGWIDYAYELVGAQERTVSESNYRQGRVAADPLRFEVTWR